MKRFTICVALLLACLTVLPTIFAQFSMDSTPNRTVKLTSIDEELWIVEEYYPDFIPPFLLVEIYDLLHDYTDTVDTKLYGGEDDKSPAVIRFVPIDATARFPDGTEGYAGMCDRVQWHCISVPATDLSSSKYCSFELVEEGEPVENTVRYALIQLPDLLNTTTMQETVGFTVHEMSHLLGTIDGIRCPYHESYDPIAKLPPDPNDSYWWFGVQGVFGLEPEGIVLLALNDQCDRSDDQVVCGQLAHVFEQYLPILDEVRD